MRRYWCLRYLGAPTALGTNLSKVGNVWTDAEYAQLMREHDLFLNLHKGCDDRHNPITFRVSNILNAGGLVISERAFEHDERAFEGLVSFVDTTATNLTGVEQEYHRLARMSATERAALGARRRALFMERFAPARIFERAGIYSLLDRHFFASASGGAGHRSSRGGGGEARSQPVNAVFAAIDVLSYVTNGTGFAPSAFLPFICSFLRHVPHARLVLFVRPAAAARQIRWRANSTGGSRGGSRQEGRPHPRIQVEPWPRSFDGTPFTQVFRYQVYADFLAGAAGRAFDKVAVSDAADVAFQADPFDAVRAGDDLVFGNDKDLIGRSRGNRYWLNNLYGKETVATLGGRNVSTSGFTMGRRAGMLKYLQRMAAEVQRLIVPRLKSMEHENWMLAKGYDQGVHIWLLYSEFLRVAPPPPVAVRVLAYDEVYISGAARMLLGRDVVLERAVVRNMRNTTIAVVHQYNRMQWDVQNALSCHRRPRGGAHKEQADYCADCHSAGMLSILGATLGDA